MTNPMTLPWREDPDPDGPLDPMTHSKEADETVFLEMDSTRSAFREFQALFANRQDFDSRGWLVVVQGDKRTGKTTVINQCAHWAVRQWTAAKLHPRVINLRAETTEAQNETERLAAPSSALIRALQGEALTKRGAIFENPNDVYANAKTHLQDSAIPIVLLPTMQTAAELTRYATRARARLLLFTEITDLDKSSVDTMAKIAQDAGLRKPSVLRLGALEEVHVRKFLDARIDLAGLQDRISLPPDDLIHDLATALPITIGGLQALLYNLYEDYLQTGEPLRGFADHNVTGFMYRYLARAHD